MGHQRKGKDLEVPGQTGKSRFWGNTGEWKM